MQNASTSLVLLGHGSTQNDGSEKPVFQHAATLRNCGQFAAVREAFWKQEPHISSVLAQLNTPQVIIVPVFISEGYFSEQVIPPALGFPPRSPGQHARSVRVEGQLRIYCRPVGTHPSMTSVLLSRADEVVRQFPFPHLPDPSSITLFIAGHGTIQSDQSRVVIEDQVARIRQMNRYDGVFPAFMEEDPKISDCYELARTPNIVMVPFFISDGLHVAEDIPVLLGDPEHVVKSRFQQGRPTWRNPTERRGKRVWYARSVGTEPLIAEVITDLVKDSLASCA